MKPSGKQPSRLKVHVPLSFVMRGGRKTIVIAGPEPAQRSVYVNAPLVKALAKAYRWRRLIEEANYSSITELAKAQRINQSYACRILRLTLLSPEIVENALNGTLAPTISLKDIAKPLPVLWSNQTARLTQRQ